MITDNKVREYGHTFFMNLSIIIRFFHAAVAGDIAQFGSFKLRGVDGQFKAALILYRMIIEKDGEIPDNELSWAIHGLLVSLYRPTGLGNRAIDCPTDQVLFIWALLGHDRYRIALHLQSVLAAFKFGFRCIAIHDARVQSRRQSDDSSLPFYDKMELQQCSGELGEHDLNSEEEDTIMSFSAAPEAVPAFPRPALPKTTILERLRTMKSKGGSLYYYQPFRQYKAKPTQI